MTNGEMLNMLKDPKTSQEEIRLWAKRFGFKSEGNIKRIKQSIGSRVSQGNLDEEIEWVTADNQPDAPTDKPIEVLPAFMPAQDPPPQGEAAQVPIVHSVERKPRQKKTPDKECFNCQELNPPDAFFCKRCGEQLQGFPVVSESARASALDPQLPVEISVQEKAIMPNLPAQQPRLNKYCPDCNYRNGQNAKYCNDCRADLQAVQATVGPPPQGGGQPAPQAPQQQAQRAPAQPASPTAGLVSVKSANGATVYVKPEEAEDFIRDQILLKMASTPVTAQPKPQEAAPKVENATNANPASPSAQPPNTWVCPGATGCFVPEDELSCGQHGIFQYWKCWDCDEPNNPATRKFCRSCGQPKTKPVEKQTGGHKPDPHHSSGGGLMGFLNKIDETLGLKPKSGGHHSPIK